MNHPSRPRRWVVVGAGAAGCAVAARLAARTTDEITVLESGPVPAEPAGGAPPRRYLDVVMRPGDSRVAYLQGWGAGGSSLVNGGVVSSARRAELAAVLPIEQVAEPGLLGAALLAADPHAAPVARVGRAGEHVDAFTALVAPLGASGRVRVVGGAEVARIVFVNRGTIGVETLDESFVEADVVVCCAGAVHTPTLLLRSGCDTAGIGVGLQDRPGVHVTVEFAAEPAATRASGGAREVVTVNAEHPNHVVVAVDQVPGDARWGVLLAGPRRVHSVGRVGLPDGGGPPKIELGTLTHPDDRVALAAVTRHLIEVARSAPIRRVASRITLDAFGTPLDSLADRDVEAWLAGRSNAQLGGFHHLAGSCRRGVVADSGGWLNGYTGVAIADASLQAGVVPADPYASVVLDAIALVDSWL